MRHPPAPGEPQLSDEQFDRLAAYGRVERVAPGDILYPTGDTGYDLFLLRSAEVDVVRDATAVEPEHLIQQRGPGDFLGELNLLTGQALYLTARVRSGGDVVRIDAERFRKVLGERGDIADVLLEALRVRRRLLQAVAASALDIVGVADSASTRELRTFAARLELPHAALDPDSRPVHPGCSLAGDVRSGSVKRVAAAAGAGAGAVTSVHRMLGWAGGTRAHRPVSVPRGG